MAMVKETDLIVSAGLKVEHMDNIGIQMEECIKRRDFYGGNLYIEKVMDKMREKNAVQWVNHLERK